MAVGQPRAVTGLEDQRLSVLLICHPLLVVGHSPRVIKTQDMSGIDFQVLLLFTFVIIQDDLKVKHRR